MTGAGEQRSLPPRVRRAPDRIDRLLRRVVVALLAAVAAVAAALRYASPSPWWIELLRYLPFPVLLAPPVLALVFSLFVGLRWVVASVAAIALVATLVMGLVWPGGGADAQAGEGARQSTLRVMTYNVKAHKAEQRLDGFAELEAEVQLQRPDVVVMQDAGALVRGRSAAAPLFGLPEVFADGQYIVASRLPLRGCALRRAETGGEPLLYARCQVQAPSGWIEVVSVHLESPRLGLNAARREGFEGFEQWSRNYEARLAQARSLAFALAGHERPLVVAGDLNAPDSSAVVGNLLGIGLRDAFAAAGRGYGYTYGHALRPAFSFLRIDHILVSPDIEVSRCVVGSDKPSEHRPVIADLRLPTSRVRTALQRLRRAPGTQLPARPREVGMDANPLDGAATDGPHVGGRQGPITPLDAAAVAAAGAAARR